MTGVSPESSTSGAHGDGVGSMRESERVLPVASIGRIMRKALPGNDKIAREARDFMQECVTEFISFITCEAIDMCQRERRKVITGDDLVWAMMSLGFEDYVEPLNLYLQLYREGESRGLRSCDQSAKKIGTDNGNTEESAGC